MKSIIVYLSVFLILLSCTKDSDGVKLSKADPDNPGKKKNVIFMVGDGMGLAQITAARTVNGGNLNMLKCNIVGIQSTHSASDYVTDSGASTTAMACGQKTNNYTIGIDVNGNPISSILEIASKNNLSTGLVTTTQIVHATPAAFYAHQTNRYQYEDIALELATKGVDFLFGGGRKYFDERSDGVNLLDFMTSLGYGVAGSLAELTGSKMAVVLISEDAPLKYLEGRGDVLPEAVGIALEHLKKNKDGFFFMVEGGQIDWACEENDQEYLIAEMLDFDRAVGKALEFAEADGNTLVVITGDHETGGYALLGGDVDGNSVQGEFKTWLHTGMMVPVFAYGPGAEEFAGVYENTEFYYKFLEFYKF
jgi:alkaline phosphatase